MRLVVHKSLLNKNELLNKQKAAPNEAAFFIATKVD